jgi:hypothetical protein
MPYLYTLRNGQQIYLIDTPGFDDAQNGNAKVFREIASLICTVCDGRGFTLGGMVYVQRITDMRMSGSSLESLQIFKKVCGERCFEDITVVTTMWNLLNSPEAMDAALRREQMLRDSPKFFGELIEGKAKMEQHHDTYASAVQIIELLVSRSKRMDLQLQREMRCSDTIKLSETTAGRFLEGELSNFRKKIETDLGELEEEICEYGDLYGTSREQAKEYTKRAKRIHIDQGSLNVTRAEMIREREEWMRKRFKELPEAKTMRESKFEEKVEEMRRDKHQSLDRDGDFETAKEDQTVKDKNKKPRVQNDFLDTLRKWRAFPSNVSRDPGQPLQRADSMPGETTQIKRKGPKTTKKGSRSTSRRHRSKLAPKHITSPDDDLEHQLDHVYCSEQGDLPNSEQSSTSESDDDRGQDEPKLRALTQPTPTSRTLPLVPVYQTGGTAPPLVVTYDPSGLTRSPPPPPHGTTPSFNNLQSNQYLSFYHENNS